MTLLVVPKARVPGFPFFLADSCFTLEGILSCDWDAGFFRNLLCASVAPSPCPDPRGHCVEVSLAG